MAHSFRHLILSILFTGLLASEIRAESAPPEKQISLEFDVACRDVVEGLAYRPAKGKNLQAVRSYSGYRSSSSHYKGSHVIEFYDLASIKEGEPRVTAICTIPAGMTKALLLFFPKAQPAADGLKYEVFAVDDCMEKMPHNSYAFINVTNRSYAAQFGGGAPIMVERGVSVAHRGRGQDMLQLATMTDEGWDSVGKSTLNLTKRNRVWVILYPPERSQDISPIIETLTQEIAPEPAVKATTLARYP